MPTDNSLVLSRKDLEDGYASTLLQGTQNAEPYSYLQSASSSDTFKLTTSDPTSGSDAEAGHWETPYKWVSNPNSTDPLTGNITFPSTIPSVTFPNTNFPNTTTPQIYPSDGGNIVYPIYEKPPVELSNESKELLKSVEEKVSELLGKHPYARTANLRKAIDEMLLELGSKGRFESTERHEFPTGRVGWESKVSYETPAGRRYIRSGLLPTENESLAELARIISGELA